MPDSFRNGTVIVSVLHAGFVHRTIPVQFVRLGPSYFGQKLRLPLLSLNLSGQTQVRLGRLCSRLMLQRILPYSYLRVTMVLPSNNCSVVGVEVSSAQALTTGSNLGAHPFESSIFGNGTGDSSQPSCLRAPDVSSGAPRSRSSRSPSEGHAVRHNKQVHGSCARLIRNHCSRSGSTRLPRAYHSRSRSCFDRSTKSHQSSSTR